MSELEYLKAKQDALSEDMAEVKVSLRDIAKALNAIATLEATHAQTKDDISQINRAINKNTDRITSIELKIASQMWVVRIIWVAVGSVVAGLVSGVL
jgi:chromosome segregation ATPase